MALYRLTTGWLSASVLFTSTHRYYAIQDVYILITHLRKLFANSQLICVNIPDRSRREWGKDDIVSPCIYLNSGLVFRAFWPNNFTLERRKFEAFLKICKDRLD